MARWGQSNGVLDAELTSFSIDRSTLFNPIKFIDPGWSIWKGLKDGTGLEGEEQQDDRSLAIARLDLSSLVFKDCCSNPMSKITGEAMLELLKVEERGFIRADARIAQALIDESGRRTLKWIRATYGQTCLDFPGTEIRCPESRRHILQLFWKKNRWYWICNELVDDCDAESAALLIRVN